MRKTLVPHAAPGENINRLNSINTNPNNLANVVSAYNTHFAGTLTPAGHCLLADGSCPGLSGIPIMTSTDMAALGWVMPTIPSLSSTAINVPWLKTFNLRASWPVTIKDRFTVEPSAAVFNVLNFANAGQPGSLFGASLYPGPNPTFQTNGALAPNVIGGITTGTLAPLRTGLQSGNFEMGAPRQIEFGLRVTF